MEWLIWLLIAALAIAAFILIGAGKITTGPRRNGSRYDRYDPVYLQQQEALNTPPAAQSDE